MTAHSRERITFASVLMAQIRMRSTSSQSPKKRRCPIQSWAAKDLPARLLAAQVAKLLNCTPEDVGLLVSAGQAAAIGQTESERR
jgi:hypothetical protein